jgi:hypothetical protein
MNAKMGTEASALSMRVQPGVQQRCRQHAKIARRGPVAAQRPWRPARARLEVANLDLLHLLADLGRAVVPHDIAHLRLPAGRRHDEHAEPVRREARIVDLHDAPLWQPRVDEQPATVESAPNRIVNSNAMITHAGPEMIGLPPVISGQSMDAQVGNANPVAAPVSPPTSVNIRTGLSPACSACSSSWLGSGENTVIRFTPPRAALDRRRRASRAS